MNAPLLQVRDAVVTFHGHGLPTRRPLIHALNGVSLDLSAGSCLGIVGESGSGKSTLARAIVGLERLRAGAVMLDGRPLTRDPRQRSRQVQMIFQDSLNSLNPQRSIGSMLAEVILIHKLRRRSAVRTRVVELLETVGLPAAVAHRRPMQLSGGQLQRVNIARALACEPRVVLADEPTSALDVSLRGQVLNLMRRLQREQNLTYLFISHDLGLVGKFSDVVGVMYLGRIVELADRDTIYRAPRHPYTRALLAAASKPDPRRARVAPIAGEPPSPAAPPPGCAFHPRCSHAVARCRTDGVELIEATPGHQVACPVVLGQPGWGRTDEAGSSDREVVVPSQQ